MSWTKLVSLRYQDVGWVPDQMRSGAGLTLLGNDAVRLGRYCSFRNYSARAESMASAKAHHPSVENRGMMRDINRE